MGEDLISNNFVDNVNKTVIKKTFFLTKVLLNLTLVYTIIDLLNWYIAISNSFTYAIRYNSTYYAVRIHPIVAVIILSLGIIGSSFVVKANRLICLSFEKNEADLFNSGYEYYNRAAKLSLVSFCVAIASAAIRLLLK
jgi:hypothetical protein